MKRRYGFTLIELLVVVAIIALLVSILMPALGRARELANQVKCATQLNGIGKAMALYQNDYKDSNPAASGNNAGALGFFWASYTVKGATPASGSSSFCKATGTGTNQLNRETWATTGAFIYLLIKYEDLVPDMFICPSADYAEPLDLQECITDAYAFTSAPTGTYENWSDFYDFRQLTAMCYAYNDPYYRLLDASSGSSLVVMADQTPALDMGGNGSIKTDYSGQNAESLDNANAGAEAFNPTWTDDNNNLRPGNSPNHSYDVQNVLFGDSHVKKHDKPTVGIQDDNIYTYWGAYPTAATGVNNPMIGRHGVNKSAKANMGPSGNTNLNDSYLGI